MLNNVKNLHLTVICLSNWLFLSLDQINPLAETSDSKLVAADAKLNFDDNAAFRQKEIFALRDTSQEDPREVCFKNYNFTDYFSKVVFNYMLC